MPAKENLNYDIFHTNLCNRYTKLDLLKYLADALEENKTLSHREKKYIAKKIISYLDRVINFGEELLK